MTPLLAYDPVYGNINLYGSEGGLVMQSAVAIGEARQIGRMVGLRVTKRPLCIETGAGVFHIGANAHDWGRPVENLDLDRLTGAPELMALLYGALTQYGVSAEPVSLSVGLAIHALQGEDSRGLRQAVRDGLRGIHNELADGGEQAIETATARLTSQPVGAMVLCCHCHKTGPVLGHRSAQESRID